MGNRDEIRSKRHKTKTFLLELKWLLFCPKTTTRTNPEYLQIKTNYAYINTFFVNSITALLNGVLGACREFNIEKQGSRREKRFAGIQRQIQQKIKLTSNEEHNLRLPVTHSKSFNTLSTTYNNNQLL